MTTATLTAPYQIDIANDHMQSLGQAARSLPQPAPCPTTMWRWHTKGIGGVKLAVVRCGGRWLTSREAMAAFIAAQTLASQPASAELMPCPDDLTGRLKAAGLI